MSVKSKVKRCNKEIIRLEDELSTYKLQNERLKAKLDELKIDNDKFNVMENIIKFALTNHIGSLQCGMRIESYAIEKMKDLKLMVDYEPQYRSYLVKINYPFR